MMKKKTGPRTAMMLPAKVYAHLMLHDIVNVKGEMHTQTAINALEITLNTALLETQDIACGCVTKLEHPVWVSSFAVHVC